MAKTFVKVGIEAVPPLTRTERTAIRQWLVDRANQSFDFTQIGKDDRVINVFYFVGPEDDE